MQASQGQEVRALTPLGSRVQGFRGLTLNPAFWQLLHVPPPATSGSLCSELRKHARSTSLGRASARAIHTRTVMLC
jgi:hypothetical protein